MTKNSGVVLFDLERVDGHQERRDGRTNDAEAGGYAIFAHT